MCVCGFRVMALVILALHYILPIKRAGRQAGKLASENRSHYDYCFQAGNRLELIFFSFVRSFLFLLLLLLVFSFLFFCERSVIHFLFVCLFIFYFCATRSNTHTYTNTRTNTYKICISRVRWLNGADELQINRKTQYYTPQSGFPI